MSSPSDSGSPSSATSADQESQQPPSTSDAAVEPAAEATSSPPAEEPRRKTPIRIGTQRYGVKAPSAVPKPVLSTTPLSQATPNIDEAPSSESSAPASQTPAEPRAEVAATEDEARVAETAEPAAEPNRPAHDKPRRPQQHKAAPPVAPPAAEKVQVPSLRGELSPDLETEYLEALGGQSLDDIIAGESAGSAVELALESRHQGRVVAIHRDDVFFDVGARQQGVIPLKNFAAAPEIGAAFDVVVGRFDPAEGLYELVLPGGAVDVGDWSEVAEGMIVEARVTGHNKGGLECEVSRLRGFIPASQVSMYRVEDFSEFVDQKFACVVTEANPEKRNLVLSRRAVLERERAEAKEKLLAALEVGQTHEGTVRSLQNFGAFVDLGGIDGLIHISQLSWDRVKHADEVLELGQKVKVKILKIDPETGKIGLGFRDLSENPWANAARDYPVRTPAKGRVSRIMDFGAFVRLGPGVEGLVHISELSHKRVFRVTDVLSEGQEVEVMVLSVDPEAQRISLSLKAPGSQGRVGGQERRRRTRARSAAHAPKKRQQPLKGGIGGPSTGERFGLKW